jgi:hypothetical protein
MNEILMNYDVDTEEKGYLPYPGGAYEDDEPP